MKTTILAICGILILSCNNNKEHDNRVVGKGSHHARSIKELAYRDILSQMDYDDRVYPSSFYFNQKHKDEILKTFNVDDSIKVGKFYVYFSSYVANNIIFKRAGWVSKIDDFYFNESFYFSRYGDDIELKELFGDDYQLAKLMNDRINDIITSHPSYFWLK